MTALTRVDAALYDIVPDTGRDATAAFRSMLQAHPADAEFIIPPGRYDFHGEEAAALAYPLSNSHHADTRRISILLKEMRNIRFDGGGARFVFHGQTLPLAIDGCDGVTVGNFTIDWDIPLSAEGRITARGDGYVDIAIDRRLFPCRVEDGQLIFIGENWEAPLWEGSHMEFDAETRKLSWQAGETFPPTTQEQLAPGLIRFHGAFGGGVRPEVGNWIVLRHSGRLHSGMFAVDSANLAFEDITVHGTGGLGLLAQYCRNLRYTRIRFEANEARGRHFVCGHDDGIHLSNNSGDVLVEQCYFRGLMDDPINIHGTTARIEEIVDSRTLIGRFVQHETRRLPRWAEAGDEIAFLESGTLGSVGVVKAAQYELLTPELFRIRLDADAPAAIRTGDALENLTTSATFTCRDNYFGSCRARGLLVLTPRAVVIENNVFESSGSAILIAGDSNFWYESGACRDVTIRNNVFGDCCLTSMYQFCEGIISIMPEIPAPARDKPFHRNIRIENNVFQASDYPVLYAFSTDGVAFRDNTIIRSRAYAPWHPRRHMLSFDYCRNIDISGNRLLGEVLGADVKLTETDAGELRLGEGQRIHVRF